MKDDRSLFEAVLRLSADPAFQLFMEWVDEQQTSALNALSCTRDTNSVFAAQGTYKAFKDIKDLLKAAPGLLEKLRRGKPGTF